ncbi:PEP/pyruvate-binding domain-containing protein [Rhodopirellula sp. SWK7]|uniref:PEP/pyruvate-binding domain-containing protein n=1 Tax=Rhodopirellula sp. SWK7 TaxID=595460 RepID=UPI0002C0039C|nr:PEP/pyruvate-binding domain-containing protein [Rhodopirellula sp. SWK7]EMI42619.1 pyruvate phosphate dikinase PEP/pyruvate- binding protein [Rhodopirellula sp. SWK7]
MTHLDSPWIVPLVDATDAALVGGKAVNLAAMIRAGLPVPDGFVVTTEAYRSRGDRRDDIVSRIRDAHASLNSALVAARSSATAEDLAGASMAGQYDTFLNLATADDVVDSVIRCWDSIGSERVAAYLDEQGIDPAGVAMAVVVQKLVPAAVAGVLFTTNPRTGSSSEMLIEASWGLGESVVSGEVQPDIIRVASDPCEVQQYTVADKTVRLLPGSASNEPTPNGLRRRACLTFASIRMLCELGRKAARHFDHPQDIEWAIDEDGHVHLLQSRAITTLDDAAAYQSLLAKTIEKLDEEVAAGRGPWVRHNLDETLVNPTPLSWDVVRRFMSGDGGFGEMYRRVGFEPSDVVAKEGCLERIGNGIYMDCSRMPEMFFADYPFEYDPDLLRENPDAAQEPPTVPRGGARAQALAGRKASEVTNTLRREAESLDRRFDETFVLAIDKWLCEEAARDLSSLDEESLVTLWSEREEKVMGEFGADAFLPSMIEALAVAELRAFLSAQFWDEDPDELVHVLSVSPQPDQTSLANAALREVAMGERSLDEWIAAHGHRGPGEFDLATPRWRERPGDVLRIAAPLRNSSDPTAKHHARVAESEATLARLKKTLSVQHAAQLDAHVRLLQRYVRFREDGKYHLMRAYAVLRETALECGRRLGIGDDVFYLSVAEMSDAMRGGYLPEDRIAKKKCERHAAARFYTPRVIEAQDVETLGQHEVSADAEQWSSHPVSCGTASGPVRVVLTPESAPELGVGYIFVCPSTDPSWTPLFANAAGLVLERGGTLSHGAIVARELGLPAVVLDDATKLFADGEVISVDANQGRVARASSDSAAESTEATDYAVLEREILPPPIGPRETSANQLACLAAIGWGVFLAAFYLLPAAWVKEPAFALIDWFLWPLVRSMGMVGTVALVGGVFSLFLLVVQRLLTDNARLFEAKRRSAKLRREAMKLPADSLRRAAMMGAVKPVSGRVLRASMVPLAWVLGPMMMVFLWFPERVDPAVWNPDPGHGVSIVAEIDGDIVEPVKLEVPSALALENGVSAERRLPEIRRELEELRLEWQTSELMEYPWEIQAAGDHAREALVGSLNAFLREGIPPQKLSWRLNVPGDAVGRHLVRLYPPPPSEPVEIPIAFGDAQPPVATDIFTPEGSGVVSLEVIHPRPLTQRIFWTPLASVGGPAWDFGWLGAYLVAYLAVMLIGKRLLRIP